MARELQRFVAPIVAGLVGMLLAAAAGVLPTLRLAGNEGVVALAIGCVVGLGANWIGLFAFAVLWSSDKRNWATAMLTSTGVRFGVAVSLGLGLAVTHLVAPMPFLIWVGLSYIVALMAEVIYLVRALRDVPGE